MTNQSVVLVGGGGHAKVVRDIFESIGTPLAGCVCPRGTSELEELAWLGEDDDAGTLRSRGFILAHVAIGNNLARQRIARFFEEAGFRLVSAISQRAAISARSTLGAGVAVMPGAVINTHARIGDCAVINTSASVDHDCHIGDYAHIGPGCSLAGNVTVGEGAFLGTGARVIPGIHIGQWSVIGAGSVVIRPIADSVVVAGVPARPLTHYGR